MSEEIFKASPSLGNIAAIILAGGYSSRMKNFKPLMPLGDATIIEHTLKVFKNAGIKNITVVIGYQADGLKSVIDRLDVSWVYNENFNEGMFSSIVKGVKSLRPEIKGFLLLPADMPLVKVSTINKILEVYEENKGDIVYPVYKGRRGHPPFISSNLFGNIKRWDGTGGLQELLSRHQEHAYHVEVEDPGILADIDTQEDYDRLSQVILQQKP